MTVGVHLPFGMTAAGRLVCVADAARGAADGLICPECRAPLVAKKGDVLRHHFAHAAETDCEAAYETMLHILGKQVIADEMQVKLPEVSGLILRTFTILADSEWAELEAVRIEAQVGKFRPDLLVFESGGRSIAIEILVTHKSTPEKLAAYRESKIDAIEIDLGHLRGCDDRDALIREILCDAPRHWLFNRDLAVAQEKALREERARIERAKAAETARLARIAAERARDEDFRRARELEDALARKRAAEEREQLRFYDPSKPDALRDGLYRGFHAHHQKQTFKGAA